MVYWDVLYLAAVCGIEQPSVSRTFSSLGVSRRQKFLVCRIGRSLKRRPLLQVLERESSQHGRSSETENPQIAQCVKVAVGVVAIQVVVQFHTFIGSAF